MYINPCLNILGRETWIQRCNVLEQVEDFLRNERDREEKKALGQNPIQTTVIKAIRKGDLHYSVLKPNSDLYNLGDESWVKIYENGHHQYGNLCFDNYYRPFLITSKLVQGNIELIEVDSVQLLEMQLQALLNVKRKSTIHTEKINDIISGNYRYIDKTTEFLSISFYDGKKISKNESQQKAVKRALTAVEQDSFFLIHGPPGTGKTTVITEISRQLLDMNRKVLITSHANVAVDNVLENLLEVKTKMIRLGPKSKVTKKLQEIVPKTIEEYIQLNIRGSQIVGASLSKLLMLVLNGKLSYDDDVPFFDTVIVDESQNATIAETLAGVLLGKSFILVGDHHQLPPITDSQMPPSCKIQEKCKNKCESLFRLLISSYENNSELLNIQFRSHPSIANFSATQIYRGKVKNCEECHKKKLNIPRSQIKEDIAGAINDKPVCYIDMHYTQYPVKWDPDFLEARKLKKKSTACNLIEATFALKIRHNFMKLGIAPENIGIISPYRFQRKIINNAISRIYRTNPKDTVISIDNEGIVGTVDSMLGKEKDMIIYTLTWIPTENGKTIAESLKEIRRLNVALTRAKKKLIIIGDLHKIYNFSPQLAIYGRLEKYLTELDCVVFAPKLDENDPFLSVITQSYNRYKHLRDEITQKRARIATKNLRKDFPDILKKPTEFNIANKDEFENLQVSYLWDDLGQSEKVKCYDLRTNGVPFKVIENYNENIDKREIIISYEPQIDRSNIYDKARLLEKHANEQMRIGKYEEAKSDFLQASRFFKSSKNPRDSAIMLFCVSKCCKMLEEHKQAAKYAEEAARESESLRDLYNAKKALNLAKESYNVLANTELSKNDNNFSPEQKVDHIKEFVNKLVEIDDYLKRIENSFPKTIEQCFVELENMMSKKELQIFKNQKQDDVLPKYHKTVGKRIRESWGLEAYERHLTTPTKDYFDKEYFNEKIGNYDEISAKILIEFYRYLQ